MSERIMGKVAAIVDRQELVLNVGSDAGVTEGMVFAVLYEGPHVYDPDTGADLGEAEIAKILVKAVRVKPNLTHAVTFQTFTRNVGGQGSPGLESVAALSKMFQPPKWETYTQSFEIEPEEATLRNQLIDSGKAVRVGDPVVQFRTIVDMDSARDD